MKVAVLGGEGFLGSAFVRYAEKYGLDTTVITRDNYHSLLGQSYDVLIDAKGNSKKFLALEDPRREFEASVVGVQHSLLDFRYSLYVLCSSVDVYSNLSDVAQNSEDALIEVSCLSRYGCHKLVAERLVMNYAASWLIFRFGGFVGLGLKKNPIYDMLNSLPLRVDIKSAYQYLSTDFAAEAVFRIVGSGRKNEIFNLSGKGVISLDEVADFLPSYQVRYFAPNPPLERYEMNIAKIEKFLHVPGTAESVREFIRSAGKSP